MSPVGDKGNVLDGTERAAGRGYRNLLLRVGVRETGQWVTHRSVLLTWIIGRLSGYTEWLNLW